MIVDARYYTVAAGKMAGFLDRYGNNGLPLQRKHGFDLAGYFTVETGPLNQVVHLWYWDSQAQREECQVAATSDPEWPIYQAANGQRMELQENRYLVPTDFSPLK